MTPDMNTRVAVVTGAGRGIGRAIALQLARMGAKVVVNDYGGSLQGSAGDPTPAQQVAAEINAAGGAAVANGDSVADWDGAKRIIDTALSAFGHIDALVNNAGTIVLKPIWEMDRESFESVVGVHLFGTFNCTRHAVTHMREQGYGRIVNVISRAGMVGMPEAAAYSAGKGGIYGFTNAVARDLIGSGVNINIFNPAAKRTRMFDECVGTVDLERYCSIAMQPGEIAVVAGFLASEACAFSGQALLVQPKSVGLFPAFAASQVATNIDPWTPEAVGRALAGFDIPPLKDF